MKQNYYEILEVDKNASKEIIKKAYTTLAKKYHPDLQSSDMKHLYEEKLKLINEAYEILSDNDKRVEYDATLTDNIKMLENQIAELSRENELLKRKFRSIYGGYQNNTYTQYTANYSGYQNNTHTQTTANYVNNTNYQRNYERQYSNRNTYNNSSVNNYKKRNGFFRSLLALFLTILIILLLSKLPFVFDFILNFIFI